MKRIAALFAALVFAFSLAVNVHAQASETIWISSDATQFKTGETVVVTVNASSVTPIQGFTFQIRYDPACLKPQNAASPIPGMNPLSLPQSAGLVDATFASTVPQYASGVIAQVAFEALQGCQTNLVLESAALAVKNEAGYAAPLPGVKLGPNSITVTIDPSAGTSQPETLPGTPLPLDPNADSASSNSSVSLLAVGLLTVVFVAVLGFIIYRIVKWIVPADEPS